jgi:hypothetical protein
VVRCVRRLLVPTYKLLDSDRTGPWGSDLVKTTRQPLFRAWMDFQVGRGGRS